MTLTLRLNKSSPGLPVCVVLFLSAILSLEPLITLDKEVRGSEICEVSKTTVVLPVFTTHDADIKDQAIGSQVAGEVIGAVFN